MAEVLITGASGFVGGSGTIEQPVQLNRPQGFVQASAAFSGGNRQSARLGSERVEHRQDARKEADVVLVLCVVVPVAQAQRRMLRWRHIGSSVRQRLRQPHANDIRRRLIGGATSTHIDHCRLDTTGNQGS